MYTQLNVVVKNCHQNSVLKGKMLFLLKNTIVLDILLNCELRLSQMFSAVFKPRDTLCKLMLLLLSLVAHFRDNTSKSEEGLWQT